ncbi:hypothetical protein VTJ49DRAFT_6841 [Mycothermus thermophilus]|uniref:DNA (cytosine-5-)-methyltransferase n=1 Tax=Humicola insolens TaxID=85995 RepID=A0ABR3VQF2_HUMIN
MIGTRQNPVPIVDSDDEIVYGRQRRRRLEEERHRGRQLAEWAARRNTEASRCRRGSVLSNTSESCSEEAQIEEILEGDIAEVIDLTGDDAVLTTAQGNPVYGSIQLTEYRLPSGFVLRRGINVELANPHGHYNIQYMRITSILRPADNQEVLIRGLGFTRTRELHGMLPPRLNELALVAEIRSWDHRHWEERAAIEVPVREVLCAREIRITNTPFPAHRFDPRDYARRGKQWIEKNGPLVCRYVFEVSYHGSSEKPYEWAFIALTEGDADQSFQITDHQNISRWRGGRIPGGSHNPNGPRYCVFDVDSGTFKSEQPPRRYPSQRYTAGDVFAGGGGASRGMERAGAKLVFAVDHWAPAVSSLRRNFPDTRVYDMEVTDFIHLDEQLGEIDLLHLSPPCQFWSPAHTVAGKNDDANMAVLFSCTHLVEKIKPRVFTVEQTFGILSPRFEEFFNTFLSGFTKLRYSVRWKVVPLANFGVPQLRRRLIMIGAAPGEKLAPFPPTTHSKDGAGGLLPWTTPKAALRGITENYDHPLHDIRRARFDVPRPRWDPTKLAKTITTHGGHNYHWSGTRDFTLLEYAVLQGFPKWHRFEGGSVKKQIGNAFAPSVVRLLYKHLIDWLLRQDGFDPATQNQDSMSIPHGVVPRDVVTLDDDDGGVDSLVAQEEQDYGNGVVYLGSRSTSIRLSVAVRRLNQEAAGLNRAGGDAEMFDDVSDSETVRGDPEPQGDDDAIWLM